MTAPVTRVEFRVRYAETDRMGVVYHGNYLVWCEIGRTEHMRQFGVPYREMEERGVSLAVAEASIRYQKPARYDDLIRVETTLADVSSRTVTFDYAILNADSNDRLATARTTLVSLDASSRVATIPAEFRPMLRRAAGLPE
ncbi:MAG TPA: thioesterase family protein [Gemmatimonadaceae bacterium]|nr:thioesterase family protein [Gemmatimonadaceae bacterium]